MFDFRAAAEIMNGKTLEEDLALLCTHCIELGYKGNPIAKMYITELNIYFLFKHKLKELPVEIEGE
jgi:hypothetical protein